MEQKANKKSCKKSINRIVSEGRNREKLRRAVWKWSVGPSEKDQERRGGLTSTHVRVWVGPLPFLTNLQSLGIETMVSHPTPF